MKWMSKSIGLAILAVAVSASLVQAEVYFDENLDNFATGRVVAQNVTWWSNINTTSGGTATWRVTTGSTASSLEVVADPGGRSGNSLYYSDWSNQGMQVQIMLNEQVSEKMRVKYDFFYASPSPTYNYISTLFGGETYNSIYDNLYTASGATEARYYTNNDGVSDTFANGQWYTVTMDIPERTANEAFVYDLTVAAQDGTVVYSRTDLASDNTASYTNYITFTNPAAANYSRFYLDNISVETVPEPATMALVAAGALGLIRRRRK